MVAPPGVIIGVIGEKGSGVTELLKLAGGSLPRVLSRAGRASAA